MSRSLPLADMSWAETHDLLRLELIDGTVKRLGTAKMFGVPVWLDNGATKVEEVGDYAAHLMKSSSVKQSLTRAADRVNLSIQNIDRAIGLTLNSASTTLIGAKVVFAKAFKIPQTDEWVTRVLLTGEISDVQIDQSTADVTIVSDTAPNVAFLTNRPLQKTCPLAFKGVACGYVGALTTCNKLLDSPDGCAGRNNIHRFGGFPARGEIVAPIIGTGFGGSGGGGVNRGGAGGSTRFSGNLYPDPDEGRVIIPFSYTNNY